MKRYREKPKHIDAERWMGGEYTTYVTDNHPMRGSTYICEYCGKPLSAHGWLPTARAVDHTRVCPGHWVVRDHNGLLHTLTHEDFVRTYEEAVE